jgi:hypothetical protein
MLLPSNGWDLVCPGIAIGDADSAMDVAALKANGFTHVLNTCEGDTDTESTFHVVTGQVHYGEEITYAGFPAARC